MAEEPKDNLSPHPTLLRYPSWLVVVAEEQILPLPPEEYKVTPGDWWSVRVRSTGELIYNGIGPVDVVRSPAPF